MANCVALSVSISFLKSVRSLLCAATSDGIAVTRHTKTKRSKVILASFRKRLNRNESLLKT